MSLALPRMMGVGPHFFRTAGIPLVAGRVFGVLGLAGALGPGRAARSLLFEHEAHGPLVLGSAVLVVVTVALGASWLPARWARRVSPVAALRGE